MTTLSSMDSTPRGILAEALHRQRALTAYGLLLLVLTPFMLLLQRLDVRTFDDIDVWAKPTKFVFSVAVYALTTAWFFGYVRPDRRNAPSLRAIAAVIIAAGSFEIIYISWQAGHGLASHFNISSALVSWSSTTTAECFAGGGVFAAPASSESPSRSSWLEATSVPGVMASSSNFLPEGDSRSEEHTSELQSQ